MLIRSLHALVETNKYHRNKQKTFRILFAFLFELFNLYPYSYPGSRGAEIGTRLYFYLTIRLRC